MEKKKKIKHDMKDVEYYIQVVSFLMHAVNMTFNY